MARTIPDWCMGATGIGSETGQEETELQHKQGRKGYQVAKGQIRGEQNSSLAPFNKLRSRALLRKKAYKHRSAL